MNRIRAIIAMGLLSLLSTGHAASPQSTAFTYQGTLAQNGTPTNGSHDLKFALFNAPTGGTQIGSTINQPAYPVANGVFTIDLNFGLGTFNGTQLYLQVTVDGTALSPRQAINSVPVAQYALSGPGASSTATAASATQFQDDHLYAGVSVNGQNPTMVLFTNPPLSPSGSSTVKGFEKSIDVFSVTGALVMPITFGSGGTTIGRASAPDVRVLARFDKAYVGHVQRLVTGTSYTGLQIDVLDEAGEPTQIYCYGSAFVSGLQPMPQADVYEMTLTVGQAVVRVANPASPGAFFDSGWNFITNTAATASICVQ